MSSDPTVRRIAENGLKAESSSQRKKFYPATVTRDTLQLDPSMSRKALKKAAKVSVTKADDAARLRELQNLPQQDHLIRSAPPDSPAIWAEAIQGLPDALFKFALNAAHDTLPHNANLFLWKKRDNDVCPLCSKDSQNLVHVLNSCPVALDLWRYNQRHDLVLETLYSSIQEHLPETSSSSVDLSNTSYRFPCHIEPTDTRPDIVCWNDSAKEAHLVELTVCFDTLYEQACRRKEERYHDLAEAMRAEGYKTDLITVEVGARGMLNLAGFLKLKGAFTYSNSQLRDLMVSVSKSAIRGSFKVWTMRKHPQPDRTPTHSSPPITLHSE